MADLEKASRCCLLQG